MVSHHAQWLAHRPLAAAAYEPGLTATARQAQLQEVWQQHCLTQQKNGTKASSADFWTALCVHVPLTQAVRQVVALPASFTANATQLQRIAQQLAEHLPPPQAAAIRQVSHWRQKLWVAKQLSRLAALPEKYHPCMGAPHLLQENFVMHAASFEMEAYKVVKLYSRVAALHTDTAVSLRVLESLGSLMQQAERGDALQQSWLLTQKQWQVAQDAWQQLSYRMVADVGAFADKLVKLQALDALRRTQPGPCSSHVAAWLTALQGHQAAAEQCQFAATFLVEAKPTTPPQLWPTLENCFPDALVRQVRYAQTCLAKPAAPSPHASRPLAHLMLHGPPSTGKSLAVRALAAYLQLPLYVTNERLLCEFQNKTVINIGQLYHGIHRRALAANGMAILQLDEADRYMPQRQKNSLNEKPDEVAQWLSLIDGAQTPADSRVIVMGTTNRLDMLDAAALSRFNAIEFGLPSVAQLSTLWRHQLNSSQPSATALPLAANLLPALYSCAALSYGAPPRLLQTVTQEALQHAAYSQQSELSLAVFKQTLLQHLCQACQSFTQVATLTPQRAQVRFSLAPFNPQQWLDRPLFFRLPVAATNSLMDISMQHWQQFALTLPESAPPPPAVAPPPPPAAPIWAFCLHQAPDEPLGAFSLTAYDAAVNLPVCVEVGLVQPQGAVRVPHTVQPWGVYKKTQDKNFCATSRRLQATMQSAFYPINSFELRDAFVASATGSAALQVQLDIYMRLAAVA